MIWVLRTARSRNRSVFNLANHDAMTEVRHDGHTRGHPDERRHKIPGKSKSIRKKKIHIDINHVSYDQIVDGLKVLEPVRCCS